MTDRRPPHPTARAGASPSWYRRQVEGTLRGLRDSRLTVIEGGTATHFGADDAELQATIEVHDARFWRRLCWGGDLGAAEALLDGDWTCDDLTQLVRIAIRNASVSGERSALVGRLLRGLARARHWLRSNTRRGARRNIRRHYDLGNDFFQLFLDDSLSYSCAIFEAAGDDLHRASLAKIDRACQALDLGPEDHLLEIGTGWGALAIHAASRYGCRVTTTTISREQFELARRRVAEAGLADRITVLERDYRDLSGQFDKLVSIEMIEAVGHRYYERFFAECARRLRPDGLMLLQGIVIADHLFDEHVRNVDFIGQYIFPGGCLPSTARLLGAMAGSSDMRCLYLEDFAPHYAETLRRWRASFHLRLDDVRSLGFDERFVRMWNYYFCYCEAAFEERRVNVVQMLLGRPQARRVLRPVPSSTSAEHAPALAVAGTEP